jgi:hypothetical protein
MSVLVLTAWLVAAGSAVADTTLEVRRGDRVVVQRVSGELRVVAWNRDVMEIRGRDRAAQAVTVSRSGNRLVVRTEDRKGRGYEVDAVLRIPGGADLEIQGESVDVWIEGTQGSVQVRNVSGDIRTERTTGTVSLFSVEGRISVSRAQGAVTAKSHGDDIRMVDVVGAVDAETGSGDLHLAGVETSALRAKTLDGDVFFSGPLAPGGTYSVWVHQGDADLELPADVGAHVSVATFDGEFTSDFPVLIQRYTGGGVFDFVLGDGSARLEVHVFDGEIGFRRRGER